VAIGNRVAFIVGGHDHSDTPLAPTAHLDEVVFLKFLEADIANDFFIVSADQVKQVPVSERHRSKSLAPPDVCYPPTTLAAPITNPMAATTPTKAP
jgi:hypothetical protein